MNDLPHGWEWSTLGEVCDINPRFKKAAFADEQLLTFLPMSAVETETGYADVRESRTMGELRNKSYRGFREGDVLFAKITPSMENGKAAVAQSLHEGWGMGSTEFHVLRPHQGVEPWYIAFYVLQKSFRAEAQMHMTGTAGQLRVPAEFLKAARIPVPPTGEQSRTVERIETIFVRLDAVETRLNSLLEKLNHLRSAILADVFHAGRDLPPSWKLTTLGAVCLQVNKTDPRKFPDSDFTYVDIGGVGMATGEIKKTRTLLGMEAPSRARQVVKAGDTLLSTVRTYQKKTAVVPPDLDRAIASTGFSVLRPSDVVHSNFLFYQVFSDGFVKSLSEKQTGTSYPAVRDKDVRSMPFRLAPLAQQEVIVDEIEDQFTKLDLTKDLVRSLVGRVALLRQSVLAEAFAGRLVPQDPDDEPASVLLERIAATQPAKPKRRTKETHA